MQTAVLGSMSQSGLCDHAGQPACSSMCLCLLNQESGSADTNNNPGGAMDLAVCQDNNDGSQDNLPPGYCYVDPGATPPAGNRAVDAEPRA